MPNIFGFKSNKAKIKTYDANEIAQLKTTLENYANTQAEMAQKLANIYTDNKIDALPAGGLYQPLSHTSGTRTITHSNRGSSIAIPDCDLLVIDLVVSGAVTIKEDYIDSGRTDNQCLAFGFNHPCPGLFMYPWFTTTPTNTTVQFGDRKLRAIFRRDTSWYGMQHSYNEQTNIATKSDALVCIGIDRTKDFMGVSIIGDRVNPGVNSSFGLAFGTTGPASSMAFADSASISLAYDFYAYTLAVEEE